MKMAVAAAGLGLLLGTTACGSTSAGGAQPSTSSIGALEQNAVYLAKLDGNRFAPALYEAGIEALEPACTQTITQIAGLADAGYQDLVKNGMQGDTRLGVLGEIRMSVPETLGKTDCAGILASYLVLRETPKS